MYAYQSGQYDAAIKLCQKLLPVSINGNYAKQGLHDLNVAAQQAKLGHVSLLNWNKNILPFDPFENVDINALLKRKIERPTKEITSE
jgi:hypothetical protein